MLMLSETAWPVFILSMRLTLHSYTRLNGGTELAVEQLVLGRFPRNSGCSLCSWRCSQMRSRLVELAHEDLVQRRWIGAPSGLLHDLPAPASSLMLNACTTYKLLTRVAKEHCTNTHAGLHSSPALQAHCSRNVRMGQCTLVVVTRMHNS